MMQRADSGIKVARQALYLVDTVSIDGIVGGNKSGTRYYLGPGKSVALEVMQVRAIPAEQFADPGHAVGTLAQYAAAFLSLKTPDDQYIVQDMPLLRLVTSGSTRPLYIAPQLIDLRKSYVYSANAALSLDGVALEFMHVDTDSDG